MDKYAQTFNKVYPNVTVKFEGISNYESEVPTRMNTNNYGDVLAIPSTITPDQLAQFFDPLGTYDSLNKQYISLSNWTSNNQVYGMAADGGTNGVLYNKNVFKQAGITTLPKTFSEFSDCLAAIKSKTSAIPLYTNYKDGWTLLQWMFNIGTSRGAADARNSLLSDSNPWKTGGDMYNLDSVLFNAVKNGQTEPDPATTDYTTSMNMLATGKIGVMVIGSFAIGNAQQAAKTAGTEPSDIGYMAYPVTDASVRQKLLITPGYGFAINKNSKNKDAARAWLDWYVGKSNVATDTNNVSTVRNAALPSVLKDIPTQNTDVVEAAAMTPQQFAQFSSLSKESGLAVADHWQKLVDVARGASAGTMDSYFNDSNTRFQAARKKLGL